MTNEKKPAPIELTEVFNLYRIHCGNYGGNYVQSHEKLGEQEKPLPLNAGDFIFVLDIPANDANAPSKASATVEPLTGPLSGKRFYVKETMNQIKQKRAAARKL